MNKTEAYLALEAAARERILILDGAMGVMLQGLGLAEEDFVVPPIAGRKPLDGRSLKGNNDALSLSRPEAPFGIHRAYLEAGADIITTNTFGANGSARPTTQLRLRRRHGPRSCPRWPAAQPTSSRPALPRDAASSPARSAPRTRPSRSRPTPPTPRGGAGPSRRCQRPIARRPRPSSRAARTSCSSRRCSTPSTPRRRSTPCSRSSRRRAGVGRSHFRHDRRQGGENPFGADYRGVPRLRVPRAAIRGRPQLLLGDRGPPRPRRGDGCDLALRPLGLPQRRAAQRRRRL